MTNICIERQVQQVLSKKCWIVTSPSNSRLFLKGKICAEPLPFHTTQKEQTNRETDQGLLVRGKNQKSLITHERNDKLKRW